MRLFACWLFVLGGCSTASGPAKLPEALKLLEGASSIELLALDPLEASMREPAPALSLRGFGVLGSATLSDPTRRQELVRLVSSGIADSDGSAALCFNPRHGLRVRRDGRVLEVLICYECLQMRVWPDAGAPRVELTTSQAVEPEVTRLFEAAGLSVAGR